MSKEELQHLEHIETELTDIKRHEQPLQRYFLQFIILVFLAGGGWMTLDSVKALADENKNKIELQEKRDDEVDKKLTRIETIQERVVVELDEQDKKLDEILEELRKD